MLPRVARSAAAAPPEETMNNDTNREIGQKKKLFLDHIAAYDPFVYDDPKHGFPVCVARLTKDPKDAVSLDYIARKVSGGAMFGKFALSRLYFQHKNILPAEIKEKIRRHVAEYSAWFGGGTENHINMWRTAAYLFAEEWPEDTWHGRTTGREVQQRCLEYFRDYAKKLYAVGMGEWDSPVYHLFHVVPYLNVFDFAKDPAAKRIAEALLDFYLADWATEHFHGVWAGAHKREYSQNRFHRQPMNEETDYLGWLWWGEPAEGARKFQELRSSEKRDMSSIFTALAAVSAYTPKEPINNIALKRVTLPYTVFESKPTYLITGEREDVKSTYVTQDYALGACSVNIVLEWGWANNQIKPWALAFNSKKERAEITSNHPFYLDEEKPENSFQGLSPYQRLLHYKNTLLVLYQIPNEDKYPMANLRIPQGLDRLAECDGWVFVEEGNAFAAIRPLQKGYELLTEEDGFIRLKSPHRSTGFAVEAAQRRDYPTLEDFMTGILKNEASLKHAGRTVTYTTTQGDALRLEYFPPRDKPVCHVNGKQLDYERWPLFDSPYVWAQVGARVLHVSDGRAGFKIDFTGDLPVYAPLNGEKHTTHLPVAAGGVEEREQR